MGRKGVSRDFEHAMSNLIIINFSWVLLNNSWLLLFFLNDINLFPKIVFCIYILSREWTLLGFPQGDINSLIILICFHQSSSPFCSPVTDRRRLTSITSVQGRAINWKLCTGLRSTRWWLFCYGCWKLFTRVSSGCCEGEK